MAENRIAEEQERLPPRSRVHSTDRGKWTRRFYAGLVLLFAMLIVGLIAWFVWWKYS